MTKAEIVTQRRPELQPLAGSRIIVIGAGPAGLEAARGVRGLGAEVIVLEKLGDPRGDEPGYTHKSFNFTINHQGRLDLQDVVTALSGGTPLYGRAIHKPGQATEYTIYGDSTERFIMSIPRPVLRQNLAEDAQRDGVTLEFNAQVTDVDPESGTVTFIKGQTENTLSANLVIIADGLHSIADSLIAAMPEGEVRLKPEPLSYVTAMLPTGTHNLSLNHLHFWNQPGNENSFAIGVPNFDGSVAILLISRYADIDIDAHPFATPELAQERLSRDFPQLLALDPTLPDQLPKRERGYLVYKSVSHFALGRRAVIIGDAGHAAPPWAGYGANTAIHAARFLVDSLREHKGDIQATLTEFQTYYKELSRLLQLAIEDHGRFISQAVLDDPTGRAKGEFERILLMAAQYAGIVERN